MPLLGGSQREARETAQRLSRPVAHRESGFPVPGLSGLHPRQFAAECLRCQFAPGGGELRSRLCEPPAHVRGPVPGLSIRGGCTPGNSRLGAVSCAHACTNRWRTCAPMVISQANMPHGSAGQFAGVAPRAIRANGRQATLAPVQEDSARARGLHPRQFAPGGGELRSRLYEPLAHVRGGGIFRTKEPGRQFQGRGAAGSIKQKEKRPWQTPLAFSL